MSDHITTELVQHIAEARVNAHATHYSNLPEAERANVPDFVLQTWDQQDEITQNGVRETVLNQLNEILPHLIAAGWLPPVEDGAL